MISNITSAIRFIDTETHKLINESITNRLLGETTITHERR